ncbi:hypothetical protein N0V83_003191 [Neocucurbitaria cava]|uniref:Beta-lactamase-related domain-containing protein n=1 Tax=Neocucurbitaria cava TaxID=798079 RepID=A0A9W9CP19_9PLEO|nr:hypothetical protein N0V83_003191 [Neocucurbitaria cava]
MSVSAFEDAIKRAVTADSGRLLAGVTLAAAGSRGRDEPSEPRDYLAAYGTLQPDPASPTVSNATVMWLASCSKLVTAIATLQCVERGLFTLDDPEDADRLLPEWRNPEILTGWTDDDSPILQPAKEKITLRKLLTHTSGVAYDFMHPTLLRWRQSRGEGPLSMQAPITEGFATPLVFEPGSGFAYGGGLDLAGLMVARSNGCTLEVYMRRNVFDVLGMDDTSFYLEHNDIRKRLMPMTCRATPDGPLVDGYGSYVALDATVSPRDEYGGAGLYGTAQDYLKLLKSVLRNDGQLLKSESIEQLFKPCLSHATQASLHQTLSDAMAASIMIPGEPLVGTHGAGEWSHALGGIVALQDSDQGLKAGCMRWGGAPNLKWWMDKKGGTCGMFATQLFPPGEGKHAFLGKLYEKAMAAQLGNIGA